MAEPNDPAPQAEPTRCPSFDRAGHRVVALGIDLAGVTIRDSQHILERVLAKPEVQDALAAALRQAGQDMMNQQILGQPLTLDQSLSRLGTAGGGVLRAPTESEVRRQREFQRLEQGLRELRCAFDHSPVGVFVNDNKTLLIIVGSVAAIAGGVAMYHTRAGDAPAELLSLLPRLDVLKIGGVTFSAGNVRFTPSERRVSGTFGATGQWGIVRASLDLSLTFASDALQQAGAQTRLELRFDPRISAHVAGSLRWSRGDATTQPSTTATAEIGMQQRLSQRSTLQFRFFGEFTDDQQGQRTRVGVGGQLGVGQPFGPGTRLSIGLDGSLGAPPGGSGGSLSRSRLPELPPVAGGLPGPGQQPPPDRQVMIRLQVVF